MNNLRERIDQIQNQAICVDNNGKIITKSDQILNLLKEELEGLTVIEKDEMDRAKFNRSSESDFQFLRLAEMAEAVDKSIAQAQRSHNINELKEKMR